MSPIKIAEGSSTNANSIIQYFLSIHNLLNSPVEMTVFSESASFSSKDRYEVKISRDGLQWNFVCKNNSSAALRASLNMLGKWLKGPLLECEFHHEASFKIRGVIEGFYGKPWTHEQRLKGIDFYADCNMNHFMLAPKDDPWQRFDWRVPFGDEFLLKVSEIQERASFNAIQLSVSLSPGLTVEYSNPKDVQAVMTRYEQLYSIGIRHFGLLVDDIPWELQHPADIEKYPTIADAHASYANAINAQLKQIDSDIRLTVCPLVYRGRGSEPYIVTLGNSLNGDIDLMWTGRQICSEYLDTFDAIKFKEFTSKEPFYWDNYPVNDVEMIHELHVGPITGRDKDLGDHCAGLLANPMDRFELSLIAIGTFGDYLWDSRNYDSNNSWLSVMKRLVDNPRDREAISRVFRCSFGSCLAQAQAPEFSEMLDKAKYAWRTSSMQEGVSILSEAVLEMRSDLEVIQSASFSMPKWREEALPWIQKYSDGERALSGIIEILKTTQPRSDGRLSAPAGSRDRLWGIWNSLSENQTKLFGGSFILFVGELAAEIADRE